MRQPGDVRMALLKAATELTTVARSPTLRELVVRSCVGREAALNTVKNMRRAGLLVVMRTRKVDYRNKPVAEYAPALLLAANDDAAVALGAVLILGLDK